MELPYAHDSSFPKLRLDVWVLGTQGHQAAATAKVTATLLKHLHQDDRLLDPVLHAPVVAPPPHPFEGPSTHVVLEWSHPRAGDAAFRTSTFAKWSYTVHQVLSNLSSKTGALVLARTDAGGDPSQQSKVGFMSLLLPVGLGEAQLLKQFMKMKHFSIAYGKLIECAPDLTIWGAAWKSSDATQALVTGIARKLPEAMHLAAVWHREQVLTETLLAIAPTPVQSNHRSLRF